ncbi:putative transport protein [Bordetella bronchiseptica Bbr77]|nr:putative transport protein [Bordetella bronchiseptica Bbr77]
MNGADSASSTLATRRPVTGALSLSAIVAGLVAVLVSFGGTAVLMVQAGHAAGLDAARIGSWLGSICLALGVGGALISLRSRMPVVFAWSTPGAALLVTGLVGVPFDQAVGAFMLAAALTLACGVFGWIDPIVRRIPAELAAAMLAGVLLNFGMGVFGSIAAQPVLVLSMCAAYLLGRRWAPRFAVLAVLVVGLAAASSLDLLRLGHVQWAWTEFVWTTPSFTWQAAISLGIPLFVVAMASQNLPGLAILQAAGYRPPASRLHSVTLGAIIAALCAGPEAHADPGRRYVAAATYGLTYVLLSVAAGAVAVFFQALPGALIAALAGLALLGAIMGGMTTAMADPQRREAALVTLLATASGISFWGIGSAFWGLAAGLATHGALAWRRARSA